MNTNEKIRLIADGEFEVVAKLSVDEITDICQRLRGHVSSLDWAVQERDDLKAQRDELLAALKLGRDMLVINEIKLPNTIDKMNEAIAKCEAQS